MSFGCMRSAAEASRRDGTPCEKFVSPCLRRIATINCPRRSRPSIVSHDFRRLAESVSYMRYDAHDIAVMMRVNRIIGGFYWMNAGSADGTADIGDRVT